VHLTIPELSVVVLIGPTGSGKSTFARRHFKPTEVISSDMCRALVCDDENSQEATNDAFDVLQYVASKRLAARKLVVIDATNVQRESRKPLVELAKLYHCFPVAIVFDLPEKVCLERNRARSGRNLPDRVVRLHTDQLRRSLKGLKKEGFRSVNVLSSEEDVASAIVARQRLWTDKRDEKGPFDIIGDVHGCLAELLALLDKLGYSVDRPEGDEFRIEVRHPAGRKVLFLGDLADRGPNVPAVFRLAMDMVKSGSALCVPGNHDIRLARVLSGGATQVSHGLRESLEQLEGKTAEFKNDIIAFVESLVSHYVLDEGRLVVAHAGMKAEMQGRASGKVREFALYGETTGETDRFGLPVRYDWAADYRGKATVVYGHTPVVMPEWLNKTICIDTGSVFGAALTALKYPEMELVSVKAHKEYFKPERPVALTATVGQELNAQQRHDEIIDIEDISGKRIIPTGLAGRVIIQEGNTTAGLEVMTRFAANPKWLIYLPPTMSPCDTSQDPGLLEHPAEAFAYYRREGVSQVVCEQKHMGSRAIVVVCRDEETARKRFGVVGDGVGICYTRTGRRFFTDPELQTALLDRVRNALEKTDFWGKFETDWACFDCELMPWSAKAQSLITSQYAAVGAAASASLSSAISALRQASSRLPEANVLLERFTQRQLLAELYSESYRRYCWPVSSISDYKLAPFFLLVTEGRVHVDKDHAWHMETLAGLCNADNSGLLYATPYKVVNLADESESRNAADWWSALTDSGGEGMVVKPKEPVARGRRGLVQPAMKCRGREYLRIIYGPEYTLPENMQRLRNRSVATKRSLALREFALGIEAMERFVKLEPLRNVHECVLGVLALESEPVDPRL